LAALFLSLCESGAAQSGQRILSPATFMEELRRGISSRGVDVRAYSGTLSAIGNLVLRCPPLMPVGKVQNFYGTPAQDLCEVYPVSLGRPFGIPKPIFEGGEPRKLYVYAMPVAVPGRAKFAFNISVFMDQKDLSSENSEKCRKGGPLIPIVNACMQFVVGAAVISEADLTAAKQADEKKRREAQVQQKRREEEQRRGAEEQKRKEEAQQAKMAEQAAVERKFHVDVALMCEAQAYNGTKLPMYINVDYSNKIVRAQFRLATFAPYETSYFMDRYKLGAVEQFVRIDENSITWGDATSGSRVWKIDRNNGLLRIDNGEPIPCTRMEKL
jgi:hypothetical protein